MEFEEILGPQFTGFWSTCSPISGKRFPITLILLTLCFCSNTAIAYESDIFGPEFCKVTKKNVAPRTYVFDGEGNATLRVMPYQENRVKVAIHLNGEEVCSSRDKFVNGKIEIPVILQTENEITIKVIGKVGAVIGVSQEIPESDTTTLHCAIRDSEDHLLEGASVTMALLDGTTETVETGIDGFCKFSDPLLVGEWALVTAEIGELKGSTAVKLVIPYTATFITVTAPGPGSISGTVQTTDGLGHKAIVKNTFHSGHESATITDEQGNYRLEGLPLDGLCHTQAYPGGSGKTHGVDPYAPSKTVPLTDYPTPGFYHHDLTNGEFL
jgi:hypothetical protein